MIDGLFHSKLHSVWVLQFSNAGYLSFLFYSFLLKNGFKMQTIERRLWRCLYHAFIVTPKTLLKYIVSKEEMIRESTGNLCGQPCLK